MLRDDPLLSAKQNKMQGESAGISYQPQGDGEVAIKGKLPPDAAGPRQSRSDTPLAKRTQRRDLQAYGRALNSHGPEAQVLL